MTVKESLAYVQHGKDADVIEMISLTRYIVRENVIVFVNENTGTSVILPIHNFREITIKSKTTRRGEKNGGKTKP